MSDLDARKQLGKTHLHADRVNEALEVYTSILRDYPDDKEARIFLGDCYLAAGHGGTAIKLYTEVLRSDPNNIDLQQRLMLAEGEVSENTDPHTIVPPPDPEILENLVTRITGQQASLKIAEEELNEAKELLNKIVSDPNPSSVINNSLDEIYELLPAILELNVRQAETDGQWDLAREIKQFLAQLHTDGTLELFKDYDTVPVKIEKPIEVPSRSKAYNILFLSPMENPENNPFNLFVDGLNKHGEKAQVRFSVNLDELTDYDVVIAHNPHADPQLSKILAACAGNRIPIIVYLDEDFESLPEYHPFYKQFALNTAERVKDYNIALKLADSIVVPAQYLAVKLGVSGFNVKVIQGGWSNENKLWTKPSPKRHSLNIGWIGKSGTVEEINSIRRAIVRAMREFPETSLVITGKPEGYQLFDAVSEPRKLYLPPVDPEDFPYQLAHIDILLIPLDEKPENALISDLLLLQAGVRKIPWISSPLPAFKNWGSGGMIARSLDDWHNSIRELIIDSDLRSTLGNAGFTSAQNREAGVLSQHWLKLIDNISGLSTEGNNL